MLRLLTTTGFVPIRRACSTKLFIHAPPRLLLRAYQSTRHRPCRVPAVSTTSKTRTAPLDGRPPRRFVVGVAGFAHLLRVEIPVPGPELERLGAIRLRLRVDQ